MSAFSNLSLKKKLIGAFVTVASFTLVVTAIAWWSLAALREKLLEVANVHVPSVRSLGEIRLNLETFKTGRRAMLNPNIDLNDYRETLDRIAQAKESNHRAIKAFSSLEMTPEGAALWRDFQGTWAEWRQSNDEYFRMAGAYAKILEPCISATVPNPGHYSERALAASSRARFRRG